MRLAPGPGPAVADGWRGLPWLLALAVLFLDPGAALGVGAYFFRDISLDYLPTRTFVGRELAAGRVPFWVPQIYEGTFLLPPLYPPDLLHAFSQRPAFISWLLTLHLPLAAVCAYALARELGLGRAGATLAGATYALGGLAPSCLNLHRFLQALAWAPLVVATSRRAARCGGRQVPLAAGVLALALTTLTFEFILPALALGVALGLQAAPWKAALSRLILAVGTGLAVAGLPLLVGFGMLQDSVRAAAGVASNSLAYSIHPFALLQTLLPGLFGSVGDPLAIWWGGRFFTTGFPYFQSIYLGPLVVALACVGLRGLPRRVALTLALAGGLALWWSLGEAGGLAPHLAPLPVVSSFRFPSKLFLLTHLSVAVLAGAGIERLRRGVGWRALGLSLLPLLIGLAGLTWHLTRDLPRLAEFFDISPAQALRTREALLHEGLTALTVIAAGLLAVALAVSARARPTLAAGLLAAVATLDLWRAGLGLNPRVPEEFYRLQPGLAEERFGALQGGRVYSLGARESPAFRAWLEQRRRGVGTLAFFVNRQLLDPFNNLLDGVDSAQSSDRTGLIPQAPTLLPHEGLPFNLERALPKLRDSAVCRVLSLDALRHPALAERRVVPVGATGLAVHVYELAGAAPRAYVACRVFPAPSRAAALARALAPDFAGDREVALEQPAAASCEAGRVERLEFRAGYEAYSVELDGPGLLVTRDSHARGWIARLDGSQAPVLRANGRHRAVALTAGKHRVELQFRPPWLGAGFGLSTLGLLGLLVLALVPGPDRRCHP